MLLTGDRFLLREIQIRGRTSFIEYPLTVHENQRQQRNWNTNTGADSDYLPPESFYRLNDGSFQKGKQSSSPDSAAHIRRFPPFHPLTDWLRGPEEPTGFIGFWNHRIPPLDSHRFPRCRIRFQDFSVHPASVRPAYCQVPVKRSFQCACSRWRISRKFPFEPAQSSRPSQGYR